MIGRFVTAGHRECLTMSLSPSSLSIISVLSGTDKGSSRFLSLLSLAGDVSCHVGVIFEISSNYLRDYLEVSVRTPHLAQRSLLNIRSYVQSLSFSPLVASNTATISETVHICWYGIGAKGTTRFVRSC